MASFIEPLCSIMSGSNNHNLFNCSAKCAVVLSNCEEKVRLVGV